VVSASVTTVKWERGVVMAVTSRVGVLRCV